MAAGSGRHRGGAARVLAAVRAGGRRAPGAERARRAATRHRDARGGLPPRRCGRRQPGVRADGRTRQADTGWYFAVIKVGHESVLVF